VRNRIAWIFALAIAAALPCVLCAQVPKQQGARVQPASKAPDLSGVWLERERVVTFSAKEPPMKPWADEKYKSVKSGYGPHASPDSQDPILSCLPPGVPRIMLIPFPMQIIQTPGQVVMLFEYDHFIRQIYTDGRSHPAELDASWMGDSIGRWDGDTLVVDTIGLTEKTWLDQVGHPHSDNLHVIERIRRVDHDTLEDNITIEDPRAYTHAWTGQQIFKLRPNWRLMEYVCEDKMESSRK